MVHAEKPCRIHLMLFQNRCHSAPGRESGDEAADGVLGRTAEEFILNLSRISLEGMQLVDSTVAHILQDKTPRSGQA